MKCIVQDCGKTTNLRSGLCGMHYMRARRHGDPHIKSAPRPPAMSKHFMWGAWGQMINRCYNPNNSSYGRYGAVGTTVCDRWRFGENGRHGFLCFLDDMGERPSGMTLDRIDPDKGYSPDNCRWANPKQQRSNLSGRGEARHRVRMQEYKSAYWRDRGSELTEIGKRIHALARDRGVSLKQMASDMGYRHSGFLSAVCTGAKKPSPRVIEYLSASGALEFGGPRLVKENGNG